MSNNIGNFVLSPNLIILLVTFDWAGDRNVIFKSDDLLSAMPSTWQGRDHASNSNICRSQSYSVWNPCCPCSYEYRRNGRLNCGPENSICVMKIWPMKSNGGSVLKYKKLACRPVK